MHEHAEIKLEKIQVSILFRNKDSANNGQAMNKENKEFAEFDEVPAPNRDKST